MRKWMFLFFLVLILSGFTQTNTHTALRAFAFFRTSIPGMQRVDETGRKIDPTPIIQRFIYAECKAGQKILKADVYLNGNKAEVIQGSFLIMVNGFHCRISATCLTVNKIGV